MMRKRSPVILAAACMGLLAVQVLGLHAHLDARGQPTGVHGTHVHESPGAESHAHGTKLNDHESAYHVHGEQPQPLDENPPGHDHTGEIDISLFDLATPWAKLVPVLLAASLLLLLVFRLPALSWPLPVPAPKAGRRSRWRPPLRAPPRTA